MTSYPEPRPVGPAGCGLLILFCGYYAALILLKLAEKTLP